MGSRRIFEEERGDFLNFFKTFHSKTISLKREQKNVLKATQPFTQTRAS